MARERIDLTGQKFGKLTVVKKDKNRKFYYICKCKCGTIKSILKYNLLRGYTKSCGYCSIKQINIIPGQKFGKLTVLKKDKTKSFICRCKCGTVKSIYLSELITGHTKSCGCSKNEKKPRKYKNIIGNRFGSFIILDEFKEGKKWKCKCLCDCGEVFNRDISYIINRKPDDQTCLKCLAKKQRKYPKGYYKLGINKRLVAYLTDRYIKQLLTSGINLKCKDIPPELIELKREEIKLKRLIKQQKEITNV